MRVTAVASPAAFAVLAAVLAAVGAVGRAEAVTASTAVILAFAPSGWWSPTGRGRCLAEALLVPAAFALTMVGGAAMRRMLVPPLVLLAAWVAVSAAWSRAPAFRRPLLAACFGLAARAAVGLGLVGFGLPEIVFTVLLSAAVPWSAARRWGRRAAELSALLTAVIPWQRWPVAAAAVAVAAILWGARGRSRDLDARLLGWLPGVGAAALVSASLAPWPGCPLAQILPFGEWPARAGLVAVLILATRLRPGVAGAVWFAAVLALSPALEPTPEHRAFALTPDLGAFSAPVSTGDPYVIQFDARGVGEIAPQTPLVVVTFAGTAHNLAKEPSSMTAWRPQGGVGLTARWRATAQHVLEVPAGERPTLSRHPDLDPSVVVRIESIGPARPTPPRSMDLPGWLLAGASVVAALQLLAATWRKTVAVVPWMVLVLGALAARAPVEPLHLLGERLAPDLVLAAVVAAWLPAAGAWLARGRVFAAVAALLVPLALATPQLTPPMYGDEPFHLMLMGSLAEDHDFDVSDDLELEERPQNALYAPGWPLFHSPALGLLLLPGYVAAGRTGALVLLALMGGAVGALVARRARGLGVGETKVRMLVLAMAATYPLATYATQIWPELPGALAVATLLVLAARPRGGRLGAAVAAVAAAAVKTRLALLTFPVLAAIWLRRNRVLGVAMVAAAVAAVSALGWLTMGHPLGPYRRIRHLLPTDPALAVRAAAGLVFDAAGGLVFTAPLWVAFAAGAVMLWRRGGAGERALLAGCGVTVAALLSSSEWYGGGAPPARYLVAMLPAFVLAGGMVLQRPSRWRRLLPILVPPSAAAWWVLITRPHLSINSGDGGYWLADALSRRFAADAGDFFPSFLVPGTAAVAVPLAVVAVVALAVWAAARDPRVGAVLRRSWIAVWFVASAALVAALATAPDGVVELEAPQVRRSGGSPVPAEGTVSRFSHRRGWRLDDGDRVAVPLRVRENSEVVLEGWLLGTARRRSDLVVQWDDEPATVLQWRGDDPPQRVVLPAPPGAGRHRLEISFFSPPEGAVVLDRVVVGPDASRLGSGGNS